MIGEASGGQINFLGVDIITKAFCCYETQARFTIKSAVSYNNMTN